MRQVNRVSLGIVLCLLLAPTATFAQGSSAASITGTVTDTSGAVLPGVTVEAASPVLIEKVRSTVTDDSGEYRIIELRPGTYSVTFSLPGFSIHKRDGLELPPNFTATVNAELRLGALEETITVSGESPLVDVTSVTEQRVMTQTELSALPTAKGILSFAALMPSAILPPNAQDVGGTKGETSVRISIHGGRAEDGRLLQDGMRYNGLLVNGTGRGFYLNPLSSQDVIIDSAGGGSAEWATAGSQVNTIPKDGGNRLSGAFFTAFMNHSMQGDNFSDELKAQGLASVNNTREIYDINGVFGGPIVKDKLWFISAHRKWGLTARPANLYEDAAVRLSPSDPNYWIYTPDLSRPVDATDKNRAHNIRFTWQAAAKHKITGSYEYQLNIVRQLTGQLNSGTVADEANGSYCPKPDLLQFTWTSPMTSKLLFEAGATYLKHYRSELLEDQDVVHCGALSDNVSIQRPGFNYHGVGSRASAASNPTNERFSVSYVTGSHNFKAGVFFYADVRHSSQTKRAALDVGGLPVSYSFNATNVPTQLTQSVSDTGEQYIHMRPDLGLFVQDQWRIGRLTASGGLRFDYLRVWVPPFSRPQGVLNDAYDFPRMDCVPCWKDLNPRLGLAYDLFGNGRTALKTSLGRYVLGHTTALADVLQPSAAAVSSTTRSWNDSTFPVGDARRGNFYPDCDLRSPALNEECGAMANSSFGQVIPRLRGDPELLEGWHVRPYTWKYGLSVDHQITNGIAVSAGYYRTWFGNFQVTDNLATSPSDYTSFCVTAPTDPRLGSVSGTQICDQADINPDKFGEVDNLITFADKFGKQTEVYNGLEASFAARLPRGIFLNGGWNMGNSISSTATAGGSTSSRSDRCFIVNSPQDLYNCETQNPYQHRFKLSGVYTLPWDFQVSAVAQFLPGPNYIANAQYTSAQIAPSLGRPLSGNVQNVTINLLPIYDEFLDDRINQFDLRFTKVFRMAYQTRLQANFDIYNAFNSSAVLTVNSTYNRTGTNNWLQPNQILDARMLKLSLQLDF